MSAGDERFAMPIGRLSMAVAFALAAFHLLNVSGVLVLSTMTVRIFHLTLMLVLVMLQALRGGHGSPSGRFAAAVTAAVACAGGLYLFLRWDAIALSGGLTTTLDVLVGLVVLLLVLDATRRAVGATLAVIAVVFLAYPIAAPYLPGVLYGRGVRAESAVSFLTLSSEGVFGIAVGVASTYIVLFTIFGAFLAEFGASDFFFRISSVVTRGMRAASAKTAVLFSAMLGMISGSAAGNVAVTGTFTIPLMTREGYKPHQAGAIEAVVSTGGQIMPPVMGAAAFLMAEIVGVPYVDIMKAGLIPALLFFLSILCVVHLQAVKSGIGVSSGGRRPEPVTRRTWLAGLPFLVPFGMLIGLMVAGYSPVKASFFAICALLIVHLLATRGVDRRLLVRIGRAMVRGIESAVPISIACAAAGIIAGVLSMTGLGSKLSTAIIALSAGLPVAGLLLTMLMAIVLGMGLPTTASYLMLATVVAPALVDMGIPLLTAHMFVFYYGCVSTITPPVALASYVAGGIAGADINQVGWTGFRYGLVCYVLPFAFFFGPALLMQGTAASISAGVLSGAGGVVFLAAAIVGQLDVRLPPIGRAVMFGAGLLLLSSGLAGDLLGLALAGGWMAAQRWRARAL